MKDEINKIIDDVVGDRIGYFPDQEGLLNEIATRLDKAIGIDGEKLYKFLRSIDGCNVDWMDSEWASAVNVQDLSKAITQSRPLKCEVGTTGKGEE